MGSAHTDTPHVSSNMSTRSLREGDAPLASRVCHAWHDPFIRVTMTHSYLTYTYTIIGDMTHPYTTHTCRCSSRAWATRHWHPTPLASRAIGIPSLLYVTRAIHSCDLTYSYVAYTCTNIDDMTHSYMTHTSLYMRHVINGMHESCHQSYERVMSSGMHEWVMSSIIWVSHVIWYAWVSHVIDRMNESRHHMTHSYDWWHDSFPDETYTNQYMRDILIDETFANQYMRHTLIDWWHDSFSDETCTNHILSSHDSFISLMTCLISRWDIF